MTIGKWASLLVMLAAVSAILPALAQGPPHEPAPDDPTADLKLQTGAGSVPVLRSTELDLPVDESIKVSIEPLQVSSLVDRVLEPVTISVRCPGAIATSLYILPVDAPYGGRALDKPKLIGSDNKPEDGLTIHWSDKISSPYIKLFAVVRKKSAPSFSVRSRTIDLGIGGSRLQAPNNQ